MKINLFLKLRRCPFCNEPAGIKATSYGHGEYYFTMGCQNAECVGPVKELVLGKEYRLEEAINTIEKWNRGCKEADLAPAVYIAESYPCSREWHSVIYAFDDWFHKCKKINGNWYMPVK
jgi:hypothetical protein